MNNFSGVNNDVELSMPLNPIYISTARTTASSIAERMNFSNSKVEDIKTAVSESVNYLISNSNNSNSNFKIKFLPVTDHLEVVINTNMKSTEEKKSNISFDLIKECMDDFKIDYSSGENVSINMIKKIY